MYLLSLSGNRVRLAPTSLPPPSAASSLFNPTIRDALTVSARPSCLAHLFSSFPSAFSVRSIRRLLIFFSLYLSTFEHVRSHANFSHFLNCFSHVLTLFDFRFVVIFVVALWLATSFLFFRSLLFSFHLSLSLSLSFSLILTPFCSCFDSLYRAPPLLIYVSLSLFLSFTILVNANI